MTMVMLMPSFYWIMVMMVVMMVDNFMLNILIEAVNVQDESR